MKETVIFLDIDYVLNDSETTARIGSVVGVDDKKIVLLKEITDFLDADIVLSSTWKEFRRQGTEYSVYVRYLNEKLGQYGLEISDNTPSIHWRARADEILVWLDNHPEVKSFVVLDDTDFRWKKYGLYKHWICTYEMDAVGYGGGLKKSHVEYIRTHKDQFLR